MSNNKLNTILYETIGQDGLELVNKILTNICLVFSPEPTEKINEIISIADTSHNNHQEVLELQKSMYKQYGVATINILDLVLPLIVVPRTLLSWLILNIKPLKIGESKEITLPAQHHIKLIAEKVDNDLYNITFIKDGTIIHKAAKQTLPLIGIHILSLTELYELIIKEDYDKQKNINSNKLQNIDQNIENKNTSNKLDSIKFLLNLYNFKDLANNTDMTICHTTLQPLVATIEKLVDVLVANHLNKSNSISLRTILPGIFNITQTTAIKPKKGKEIIRKLLKRKKPESPYVRKLSVEQSGIATPKQMYHAALNNKIANVNSQSLNKLLNTISKKAIKNKIIVKSLDNIICTSCNRPLFKNEQNTITPNCTCYADLIKEVIVDIQMVNNGIEITINKKANNDILQYFIDLIRGK